jgi:branched-chain amino acid transport system substrate-binding protein
MALVLGLLAAACGDDDDDSSAEPETSAGATTAETSAETGATTAETEAPAEDEPATTAATEGGGELTATGRGVSATEITIGAITTEENWPGLSDGATARFERANAEGGVHGRTINFLGAEDDGNDPARNLDQARSLVQNDEAFALLISSTALLPATSDFLGDEQVPFMGWGFMPGYCGTQWGFGLNGCLNGPAFQTPGTEANQSLTQPSIDASGKDPSELKVALQCGEDAAGRQGCVQFEFLFEEAGAEVVYNEQDMPQPGPITDFTPFVDAILETEPDIVFLGVDFANTIGLYASLKGAGYEGLAQSFITYIPGLLQPGADLAEQLEGSYANSQFPPQEEGTPAIEQALADLEAAGFDPFLSQGVQLGYWSADIMLQMLEAVGPDLTPESFDAVINGGWTYEPPLEGGMGPVTFPEGHAVPTPCAALVRIVDAKFEVIAPYACYDTIPFS